MSIEFKNLLNGNVTIYKNKFLIGKIFYSKIRNQFMIRMVDCELLHDELNTIHQKMNELDEVRK